MNIKTYRKDIIPGWLVVRSARYALEHPPRVSKYDWIIWTLIFLGAGYMTYHLAIMVLRP